MKIGVTGHRGNLGQVLYNLYDYEPCDLNNAKFFDVIVHTRAWTDVDSAEDFISKCISENTIYTERLREVTDARIIYLSTDFIFDGEDGPYTEDAQPKPISVYGCSKWLGELALKMTDTIVRTTVLYGGPKRDFVNWVLDKLEQGKHFEVSSNMITTPTNVYHLAEAIAYMIENRVGGHIVNVAGTTIMTRNQLAKLIAETFGYDSLLIASSHYGNIGIADRPQKAGLYISKAKSLDIPVYSAYEGLKMMKEMMDEDQPDYAFL